MRIFDEDGAEITEAEVDTAKGYTIEDKLFVKHHDAVAYAPQEGHYVMQTFFFTDGTSYDVVNGNEDPHVQIVDEIQGEFAYNDQGEDKVYSGASVKFVIDQEEVSPQDEYDEYEDILRYKLYTEEELKEKADKEAKQAEYEDFIANGPSQLKTNTESIDDLYVALADAVAGSVE